MTSKDLALSALLLLALLGAAAVLERESLLQKQLLPAGSATRLTSPR